jgi:DNA-binding NarL/FixJ family response regulator
MRLLIVDDHEIVREGLLATFADVDWVTVVGTASTGREALGLTPAARPDVALVDFRLPDMSGDAFCRELLATAPSASVVILSTYLSEDTVRSALQAGASAYVTKAAGVPKLLEVLEELRRPETRQALVRSASILVKELAELETQREGVLRVTPQQERILELTAEGLTNRAIGEQLFISESTVRFHLRGLSRRIGARSRPELVAKAIRLGLIPPAPEDFVPPAER